MTESGSHPGTSRPVITLSAAYGAGGSYVGPRLAERLGVTFLDRAIPTHVADHLHVSEEDAAEHDEHGAGAAQRFWSFLAMSNVLGNPLDAPDDDLEQRRYVAATEEAIEEAASGGAVILGRAGAAVLASWSNALHVRLDGPEEGRIRQGARLEGIDETKGSQRRLTSDRAREDYVRQFYGVDARDVSLYHLVIDTVAIDLDTCVELILTAHASRSRILV